jgi:hypothetical protein
MRPDTLATPSSVDVLSPSHVVLRTLAALPIAEGVRWHTIVGDVTGSGIPGAHDGVVSYASAHLEGAESELVIDGAGHDLQLHPRAIVEVRRILAAHRP